MVNKDTADQIKCFIEERRGYSIFMLVQSLILLCLIAGLFGKAVTIELDAQNLEIRDEKVIVNEDHSFYISGWNDETSYGRWVAGTGLFDLKQGMYEVSVAYQSLLMVNFTVWGELRVDKILIKELTAWRLMKLLGYGLCCFLAVDAVYIYFCQPQGRE